MKTTLITLGLILIVVGAFFYRARVSEAAVWRALSERVPAQPLTSSESQITYDGVSAQLIAENYEIGHVRLANGDTWRFAFRSHHIGNRPDSYSVFSGPLGTYHVRGDYFCCEVQFHDGAVPQDSTEFLAFLRSVHESVELSK